MLPEFQHGRRPDEVLFHTARLDDEFIQIFLSKAMDRPGHWRVRAVFCDLSGRATDERAFDVEQKRPIAFRILRPGKSDFVYQPPPKGGGRAAKP